VVEASGFAGFATGRGGPWPVHAGDVHCGDDSGSTPLHEALLDEPDDEPDRAKPKRKKIVRVRAYSCRLSNKIVEKVFRTE